MSYWKMYSFLDKGQESLLTLIISFMTKLINHLTTLLGIFALFSNVISSNTGVFLR